MGAGRRVRLQGVKTGFLLSLLPTEHKLFCIIYIIFSHNKTKSYFQKGRKYVFFLVVDVVDVILPSSCSILFPIVILYICLFI